MHTLYECVAAVRRVINAEDSIDKYKDYTLMINTDYTAEELEDTVSRLRLLGLDMIFEEDGSIGYISEPEKTVYILTNSEFKLTQSLGSLFEDLVIDTIDISGISDFSEVITIDNMFEGVRVQNIIFGDLPNLRTDVSMQGLFRNSIIPFDTIDFSVFKKLKPTSTRNMFDHIKFSLNGGYNVDIRELDLSSFDFSEVTDASYMFYGATMVSHIHFGDWTMSKLNTAKAMFKQCHTLKELDLSKMNLSELKYASSMFSECLQLDDIIFNDKITIKPIEVESMFENSGMEFLEINMIDTIKVTSFKAMFKDSKLKDIDISHFDFSKATTLNSMFGDCTRLTDAYLGDINGNKLVSIANMFIGCSKLENVEIKKFRAPALLEIDGAFDGCGKLKDLDLTGLCEVNDWLLTSKKKRMTNTRYWKNAVDTSKWKIQYEYRHLL